MLFTPEAHEALADEPWSAERVRTAIASVVADAESAFGDGWPLHPEDEEDDATPDFSASSDSAFEPTQVDPAELTAEQLKKYLETLRPEDFGKFNP